MRAKLAARGDRRSPRVTVGSAEEIAGLVLALLVLGLFIALASYTDQDPPATAAADSVAVRNLCGTVGAHVAHFFMLWFGYDAYLLVV